MAGAKSCLKVGPKGFSKSLQKMVKKIHQNHSNLKVWKGGKARAGRDLAGPDDGHVVASPHAGHALTIRISLKTSLSSTFCHICLDLTGQEKEELAPPFHEWVNQKFINFTVTKLIASKVTLIST